MERVTTTVFREKKKRGEKIAMLTAFDYPTALILDEAGIDAILVGDSLAMVALGYASTLPLTMDEMIHHTKAVCRGVRRAMVVADMPFMSYQASCEAALMNAGRFLKETEAQAVKLEGGRQIAEKVRLMTSCGIPVMGHLGLTPQSVHELGGFKVQGRQEEAAKRIREDARIIEEAGAFSVVLEAIPAGLAAEITEQLSIPTIGIGAGRGCDGQILVTNDMLGTYGRFTPRFVKRYAELGGQMRLAVEQYRREVAQGLFPAEEHSF